LEFTKQLTNSSDHNLGKGTIPYYQTDQNYLG
jgi:hypothetical protein